MLSKTLLVVALSLAFVNAELPSNRNAPYPAAGWRPRKPFNLPGEYQPPREVEQQQQPGKVDFEISKVNLDFAGQIPGRSLVTANQPHKAYLPANKDNTDFLNAQALPNDNAPQFVASQTRFPSNNKNDFFTGAQEQPQSTFNPPQKPLAQSQPQFFPNNVQPTQKPAQQYGAPISGVFQNNYPEPRNIGDDSEDDDTRTAIENLNAAIDEYNRAQANRNTKAALDDEDANDDVDQNNDGYPYKSASGRLMKGQYYVLGPDNTLQRVMFTTSQDDQEMQNNGFTAQLKYTPVGELNDPVFKYNNRGQLARIVKK